MVVFGLAAGQRIKGGGNPRGWIRDASLVMYPETPRCAFGSEHHFERKSPHDYWRQARPRRACGPAAVRIHQGLHRPTGDRNHPTKLDHFVFLRTKKAANRLRWEADPELTRHYGGQCRELHIVLIDDDIENVFLREEATYFDRNETWSTCSSTKPGISRGSMYDMSPNLPLA